MEAAEQNFDCAISPNSFGQYHFLGVPSVLDFHQDQNSVAQRNRFPDAGYGISFTGLMFTPFVELFIV